MSDVDVVVVGAGLAGLVAARDLVASGHSVSVLEARQRVGGRTWNATTSGGAIVELGGAWTGPTQDRLGALAKELGIDTFPTYNEGESVLWYRGGPLTRYRGTIPKLPPHVLADIGQAQKRLDWMARRVPLEEPWKARKAEIWDGQTLETWLRRNLVTRGARDLLRLGVASVFAAEAADLSLLHFLFYSHSGGLLDRLLGVAGGAQERRFVGGSQLVSTRLAERLGDAVALGRPVRALHQDSGGVVAEADGMTVRARRAVVSVPPALASRIVYDPPLPGQRDQLTQKMPMGTVMKIFAFYDQPFWRSEGLTGQATSDAGPVQLTFDNSPPGGSPGVLLGFVEGANARVLGPAGEGEGRRQALDCFVRYFGPRAGSPEEVIVQNWAEEEWTRGCYGAGLAPGVWTQHGAGLRQPCGRLHWAGTETSTVWAGYMDGAVRSGERVATEVSTLLAGWG